MCRRWSRAVGDLADQPALDRAEGVHGVVGARTTQTQVGDDPGGGGGQDQDARPLEGLEGEGDGVRVVGP